MPLYQELVRRTIEETCPICNGRLGIFDNGYGPFVRCENNCTSQTWTDHWEQTQTDNVLQSRVEALEAQCQWLCFMQLLLRFTTML